MNTLPQLNKWIFVEYLNTILGPNICYLHVLSERNDRYWYRFLCDYAYYYPNFVEKHIHDHMFEIKSTTVKQYNTKQELILAHFVELI